MLHPTTMPDRRGRSASPSGALAAALFGFGAVALLAFGPALLAADPAPEDEEASPAGEQKPAAPGKPLRFTDDDLEKFHKPKPGQAVEAVKPPGPPATPADTVKPAAKPGTAAARPVPAGATPTKPVITLAPVPRPPAGATPATLAPPGAPLRPGPARAPIPSAVPAVAKPPAEDPLKQWKDREAKEGFREGQLRDLRLRISGLESRLEYLNLKRLSILDPTRIMPMPQNETDRTTDKAQGPRDLLAAVDAEIESSEEQLKQAKDDLIVIQTRFEQESGRP